MMFQRHFNSFYKKTGWKCKKKKLIMWVYYVVFSFNFHFFTFAAINVWEIKGELVIAGNSLMQSYGGVINTSYYNYSHPCPPTSVCVLLGGTDDDCMSRCLPSVRSSNNKSWHLATLCSVPSAIQFTCSTQLWWDGWYISINSSEK